MTGARDWQGQVGNAWADEWRRTDRSFAGLTPHLLTAIAGQPGSRVLDIGCGAGEISLAVARARPMARVTGIDISADLIAAARERAKGQPGVAFDQADAGAHTDPDAPPDLLVSRHGVMFFADPPAVFRHLAAQAAPGAQMVFSCFRARAENPWADLFEDILPPGPAVADSAFPPGPFAFADPAHVERCLAGWSGLTFTPVDFRYVAGAGDDPVADAIGFFSRIGPAAPRLAALDHAARADMAGTMAAILETHRADGVVGISAAAWIVTAHSV